MLAFSNQSKDGVYNKTLQKKRDKTERNRIESNNLHWKQAITASNCGRKEVVANERHRVNERRHEQAPDSHETTLDYRALIETEAKQTNKPNRHQDNNRNEEIPTVGTKNKWTWVEINTKIIRKAKRSHDSRCIPN